MKMNIFNLMEHLYFLSILFEHALQKPEPLISVSSRQFEKCIMHLISGNAASQMYDKLMNCQSKTKFRPGTNRSTSTTPKSFFVSTGIFSDSIATRTSALYCLL